jgi:DNA-binding response OmpR family regulator
LKKFAPRHLPVVAHSIEEAETLTSKSNPDLFVIDFDPSYPGVAAFLQKMRKLRPDGRALVLTGRISTEIIAEFRAAGALHFLEKPYDVAEFGATVQALLVPIGLTESKGALRHLGLADIIALQCVGGRTVILDIKGRGGNAGIIQLEGGRIIHAETDEHTGTKALIEMLGWPDPRVAETVKHISAARSIEGPWATVLLDAWRRARPEKAETKKSRARTGKKIVIVDDTEMLLIFAEDILSSADPELQITKALSGTDGLREIERVMPDLVLLDYSLPDFDGDEVCRRLLAGEQTARIPVLMMSGHVAEMESTSANFENVVATIEKPFLSEPFLDLVRRTLLTGLRPKGATQVEAKEEAVKPREKVQESRAERSAPKSLEPLEPSEPKVKEPLPPAPIFAPPTPAPMPPAEPPQSPVPVWEPAKPQIGPLLPSVAFIPSVSALVPLKAPVPRLAEPPSISGSVATNGDQEVLLGIFLEVLSMQLTPQLRMGAIRTRPAAPMVSLHFLSPTTRGPLPENGFQLGATELDEKGRLATLRLSPTARPFQRTATRSAFEIGGVALVPNDHRARVQLTPSGTTPMTMELLARLELGRVTLSPTFQVAQLILKWQSSLVRVTLDPKAPEESGAMFNVSVKLDTLGRISELLLTPAR